MQQTTYKLDGTLDSESQSGQRTARRIVEQVRDIFNFHAFVEDASWLPCARQRFILSTGSAHIASHKSILTDEGHHFSDSVAS